MIKTPVVPPSEGGYDLDLYAKLAQLEAGNFWFRGRNALILWALRRHFPRMREFLEIGCGTGYVLSAIQEAFPAVRVHGCEVHEAGLRWARERLPQTQFFRMDARELLFRERFDVIGAFDLLEHVEEDEEVLKRMHLALRGPGGLVITVPQHPFLWSRADEKWRHVRRYRVVELREKVERAGFRVKALTSFMSLLLPLMTVSRFCRRLPGSDDLLADLRVPRLLNVFFENVLNVERTAIRFGARFPVGGSLLLCAEKD